MKIVLIHGQNHKGSTYNISQRLLANLNVKHTITEFFLPKDLNFTYWMSHRPRACMFQKRAVVIATTAGAGANKAIKGVKENLMNWGIPAVKTYGIAVQAKRWEEVDPKKKEKIEKDMAKLAKKLSKKEKPQVGLKTRFMFKMMAGMHDAGWDSSPVEKEYWKENGWLDGKRPWKDFYY